MSEQPTPQASLTAPLAPHGQGEAPTPSFGGAARGQLTSFDQYLADLRKYAVLSDEEEGRLGRLAAGGDERALELLVLHNLRFGVTFARRFLGRKAPLEDLVQEANRGMLIAARRFDPEKDVKFITYASYWIKQSVLRWLAENQRSIGLPPGRATQMYKLGRLATDLEAESGRVPTEEEVAERAGMPAGTVRALMRVHRPEVRLDLAPAGSDGSPVDWLPASDDVEAAAELGSIQEQVREALGQLKRPRDAEILRMLFGIGYPRGRTLEEVGHEVGVTRERVRQIRNRAFRELQDRGLMEELEELWAD